MYLSWPPDVKARFLIIVRVDIRSTSVQLESQIWWHFNGRTEGGAHIRELKHARF